MTVGLLVVLFLILAAEFVNGWTDAPNAIATVVGTRTLSPRKAVAMAAVFNLLGVMSGTAVASTIGKGIIDAGAVNLTTVGSAMVGLILWSSLAARWGSARWNAFATLDIARSWRASNRCKVTDNCRVRSPISCCCATRLAFRSIRWGRFTSS